MNMSAPLEDRWRTAIILTIAYAVASVGLSPAILIAAAGLPQTVFAGFGIAVGVALLLQLWLNAGRQRRHNPTWTPLLLGVAVTALSILTMVGYVAFVVSDIAQ